MAKVEIIKLLIILIFSFICSMQDLKSKKVSNTIILLGCICMLIFHIIIYPENLPTTLLSAILLFSLFILGKLLLKDKLGWADIFFSIFIGLSLPYKYGIIAVLISCFLSIIIILFKSFIKKTNIKKIKIAYIPVLSISLIISLILTY